MTEFEKVVKDHLEEQGWTVYTSGWPDFLCVRGEELRAVEVKSETDSFRPNQKKVLPILSTVMKVRTAHPGPGFGDDANTNKFHLLIVNPNVENRPDLRERVCRND